MDDNYTDESRDLKKLRSLEGSTEDVELQKAYKQYLIDQTQKDIEKMQKKIDKEQKKLDKIDEKLDKLYQDAGLSSKTEDSDEEEATEEENTSSVQTAN